MLFTKSVFWSPLKILALGVLSAVSASGDVFTLSGDFLPNANVTEGSNAWTNGEGLTTTGIGSAASWVAEDGWIKMTTAPSTEIWFGTSDLGYGDNSAFSLSETSVGNRISISFLITPSAQSWGFYFFDQDGYTAWMGVEHTDNGQTRGGLWVSTLDNAWSVGGDAFDPNVLHTYEAHLHDGTVAYFLDGAMVATGVAGQTGNVNVYGLSVIGDGSGTTPTGTGSMWIDSLSINNAAGPLQIQQIPEPRMLAFVISVAAFLGALRRRR